MTLSDRAPKTVEEFKAGARASISRNLQEFRKGLELLLGGMDSKMVDPFSDRSKLEASEIHDNFAGGFKKSVEECLFRRRETPDIKRCFKCNAVLNPGLLKQNEKPRPRQHLDHLSGEALSKILSASFKNDYFDKMAADSPDDSDFDASYPEKEDKDKYTQAIVSYFLWVLRKLRITGQCEGITLHRLEEELVGIYSKNKTAFRKSGKSIETILGDLGRTVCGTIRTTT